MSFMDELKTEDNTPSNQYYDDRMLNECISAIKEECLRNKKNRYIKGYLYMENEEYYGMVCKFSQGLPSKITSKEVNKQRGAKKYGMFYSTGKQSLYRNSGGGWFLFFISDNFENNLKKEISKLGFTNYNIRFDKIEDKTRIIQEGLFGYSVKYEKNGKIGKTIYIEINW